MERPGMRVYGTGSATAPGAGPPARRAGGGRFTIADPETTRAPAASAATRTIASLDAIMALQAYEDPLERRRRAIKHGGSVLDALDDLKVGLLAGSLNQAALSRLVTVAEKLSEDSGDETLNAIMAEIGLRAAVELAKFGRK